MVFCYGCKFDQLWAELADQGRVDALGGAEWRRVKKAWLKLGMMQNVLIDWIRQMANVSPPPAPAQEQGQGG
jgi:hypothetical protein